MTPRLATCLGLVLAAALAPAAPAQERFFDVPLDQLGPGERMDVEHAEAVLWGAGPLGRGRVQLDGPGEAWLLEEPATDAGGGAPTLSLAVRAPAGDAPVAGRVYLPPGAGPGYRLLPFTLAPDRASEAARERFFRAEADHYERLLREGHAGAAWFRHRADAARRELGDEVERAEEDVRPPRRHDLEDSYELFSGGRAIAENLQLDRIWSGGDAGERTVEVDSIAGIEVRPYDWGPRVEGLEPELDPLATWIPVDQHAVFFPSFAGLVAVLDESARLGTPLLRVADPRAEDARTRERYERQLCLELDAAARLLGPAVVRSAALTGSDPYLRTGSDVALIFECAQPELLLGWIAERQRAAAEAAADAQVLDAAALAAALPGAELDAAHAVRTPDRRLGSYALRAGDAVLVGNSLPQLARLLATRADPAASLAQADEYRFFRDRYPRGAEDEAAFLLLTDAALRRWCGPRWRIGAARRTRAAALLSEHQAAAATEVVEGATPRALAAADGPAGLGEVALGPRGARSSVYGDLAFLTPILELDVERVTEDERAAYGRFRNRYQRGWRTYFDPIALQVRIAGDEVGLDLTVLPLIGGTEYREMVEVTGDATIQPGAGDPHPGAALHYVMALSKDSGMFSSGRDLAGVLGTGLDDPLDWVGDTVAFYLDEDPFWDELEAAEDRDEFAEQNVGRLPVGLHVSISNPLGLATLLTSLRAFSNQAAPGMVVWENREHRGQAYVRVSPGEGFADSDFPDLALHYAVLPTGATFALSEPLVQRAIDRHLDASEVDGAPAPYAWHGESVALRLGPTAFDRLLPLLVGEGLPRRLQRRSWSNLPVLNEWRRLFPDRDPVQVHEALWGTRLVCPGGGEYVWNEAWRTVESSVYGHPLAPREGPSLPAELRTLRRADAGLTFEDDGLRARLSVDRGEDG